MLIQRRSAGFTIVELLVTLTIAAILAGLAYPSFTGYMNNLAIRNTGEGLLVAAQTARGEAIRSNNTAVLQIVDSLDNGCSATPDGRFWVVSHCSAEGKCGQDIDKVNPPPTAGCTEASVRILAKGALDSDPDLQVDLANPMLCYSSLGRINPNAVNCPEGTLDPAAAVSGRVEVNVTHNLGACIPSGGMRCLRLTVNLGGESRLCDPSVTAPNDPRKC